MKIANLFKILIGGFAVYFFSWVLVFGLGINKLAIQSEDTVPTLFIPVTIIKEGTIYVDTYYNMMRDKYPNPDDKSGEKGFTPFYLKKVLRYDGYHYITAFPLVTGLIVIPVFLLPILMGVNITFVNLAFLSHIASALIVSTSGVFMYLLLRKHFIDDKYKAYLITIAYMFGTVNYALLSQALWQHGTLELFLIVGVYFLLNTLNAYKVNIKATVKMINLYSFLAGLSLGIAILTRPTAALVWLILTIYLIVSLDKKNKRAFLLTLLSYFLGVLICAALFFIYNNRLYVSLENQGYYGQIQSEWLSKFPEGFLGVWFSPSKGILIYSPVLVFSLISTFIILKRKKYKEDLIYIVFALIVFLHTLIISKWKHWYGGWSFGYRMSSDVIPFMILLLVPYLKSELFEKTKKLFYLLLGLSIGIEIYGMIFFDGIWHSAYDRGFKDTGWLWSLKDSEFAFNIRRVLVKIGLLDKACPVCE